jgi:hypothetical protein
MYQGMSPPSLVAIAAHKLNPGIAELEYDVAAQALETRSFLHHQIPTSPDAPALSRVRQHDNRRGHS